MCAALDVPVTSSAPTPNMLAGWPFASCFRRSLAGVDSRSSPHPHCEGSRFGEQARLELWITPPSSVSGSEEPSSRDRFPGSALERSKIGLLDSSPFSWRVLSSLVLGEWELAMGYTLRQKPYAEWRRSHVFCPRVNRPSSPNCAGLRAVRKGLRGASGWPNTRTGGTGDGDWSPCLQVRVLFNASISAKPLSGRALVDRTMAFSAATQGAFNEIVASTAMSCDWTTFARVRGLQIFSSATWLVGEVFPSPL